MSSNFLSAIGGLHRDIVLDEEAFNKAVSDFSDLAGRLQKLRESVEEMLNIVKTGFDTPAGAKFINSCEGNLLRPLDDQKLVIEHISETLQTAKSKYASVFDAYRDLNTAIASYKR